jgi:hypothetical protein
MKSEKLKNLFGTASAVKNGVNIVITFIGVCLGFYLGRSVIEIVIISLIIWVILNPTKSWQLARLSLLFFILMSLQILLKNQVQMEQFAAGVFLFLLFAVATAVYENRAQS